jgi:hypothetical protein
MPMRKSRRATRTGSPSPPVTAGARVTFRAELMPGRDAGERTYEVKQLLPSGRIELANLEGQHSLAEFEAVSDLERSTPK